MNTKGWEKGNDGDLRIGDHTDAIYKYDETLGKWLAATHRDTTLGIMGCTTKREGEIGKSSMDDEYYVCRDSDWQNAQKIDLDTYGKKCTNAEVGITIEGVVTSTNKYYCTANGWASLTGGWNWDVPKEVRLNPDIDYGLMTDSRDGKKYKTVTIGDLTWMAENLNYYKDTDPSVKTKSWCFGKSDNKDSTTCEVGGRLYTWAAAIDSVKLANDADGPQKCGYGKTCTLPAKVQGVCPPDWHLPNNTEWNALFTAVGGQSAAVYALKSQSGWLGYNGTDAFGFSALPVSCRDSDDFEFFNQGAYATFWGATENNGGKAYCMGLRGGYNEDATLNNCDKNFGRSVRCVKD